VARFERARPHRLFRRRESLHGRSDVTLQCATRAAQIFYTLDGSEPTSSSPRYAEPFLLDHNATVKAKALRDGMNPSSTAAAAFSNTLKHVGTPVISPSGGLFTGSVEVVLGCPTAGALIRYTINGGEPDNSSLPSSAPFTLTNGALVKTRATSTALRQAPQHRLGLRC
jgi:hypothetical protein